MLSSRESIEIITIKMELLSYNQKYALFASEEKTVLMEMGSFQIAGELDLGSRLGYLQYGTGIAALISGSKVRLYGMFISR